MVGRGGETETETTISIVVVVGGGAFCFLSVVTRSFKGSRKISCPF